MHFRLVPGADRGAAQVTFQHVEFDWPALPDSPDVALRLCRVDDWCRHPDFRALKDTASFGHELRVLARHVRLPHLDYAAYALLNHWLLQDRTREAREAVVESELARFYDPRLRGRLEIGELVRVSACKILMKLTPTAELGRMTFLMAWWMKERFREDCIRRIVIARNQHRPKQEQRLVKLLSTHCPAFVCINRDLQQQLLDLHGQAAVAELLPSLHMLGSMLADDGEKLRDAAVRILQSPQGLDFFRQLFGRTDLEGTNYLGQPRGDWIVRCLLDRASSPEATSHAALIERHYRFAKDRRDADARSAQQAAALAIERDEMLLPEALMDEARQAVKLIRRIDAANRSMHCRRGRRRQPGADQHRSRLRR
ncbi:hypothetical protein VARIO8X_60455 [Burkholderiales bacterium 8X]|nr:hypothetical protein VARIO8X_60455 [Burkholderiales bacterium 8X]